ncbi:hypothetical protein KOI35_30430 [Actinoplanes bogorensis]|uniref:Adhesin domain-containing protein n=1 Tax=Paractinoplanes bogorensis TaxID=1610840 RepID=A0ABS5YWM3_9ACTN|nr:hypothetical protein [Actinoplanes bogorensis]MBU2667837.1 hypothetical protein [Actinoplanes bogorensis]
MLDRLHSRSGPEVPPDEAVSPPVIDEPTQKLHIITVTAPPAKVEARAVLVYEQVQRRPWRLWAFTAVLVALTIGVVLGQAEAFRPTHGGSTAQAAEVPTPSVTPVIAPLGAHKTLAFEVSGDAAAVHVASGDLGDVLYSVTPNDASLTPRMVDTPRGPRLELAPTGIPGVAGVEVRLNSRVAWTVRLAAGSSDQSLDMRAGGLAALELAGGTARAALFLPGPKGTVKVTVSGPVGELTLDAAATPVRLKLAGSPLVDGRRVPAGTVRTPAAWSKSTARYDVTVAAGTGKVAVRK